MLLGSFFTWVYFLLEPFFLVDGAWCLHPKHVFVWPHVFVARLAHPNRHKAPFPLENPATWRARLTHAAPASPAVVGQFQQSELGLAQRALFRVRLPLCL
jgi:hypothetical protein